MKFKFHIIGEGGRSISGIENMGLKEIDIYLYVIWKYIFGKLSIECN